MVTAKLGENKIGGDNEIIMCEKKPSLLKEMTDFSKKQSSPSCQP